MSVLKIKDENTGEFIPIPSIKGDTGDAAGFGTVSATVDANHGTPSVTVTASGEDTAKNFAFEFKNLQPAPYDDSVLVARMDSFTNLAEGSTTGDAELIDGRTGADGVTYTNIGSAIRGQVTDLKSALSKTDKELMGQFVLKSALANKEVIMVNDGVNDFPIYSIESEIEPKFTTDGTPTKESPKTIYTYDKIQLHINSEKDAQENVYTAPLNSNIYGGGFSCDASGTLAVESSWKYARLSGTGGNWYKAGNRFGSAYVWYVKRVDDASISGNIICTHYKTESPAGTYTGRTGISADAAGSQTAGIYICDPSFSTVEELVSYLDNNPVYFAYRATATPETLTAQFDDIPKTINDTNYIWSNSGKITSLEYYAYRDNYIFYDDFESPYLNKTVWKSKDRPLTSGSQAINYCRVANLSIEDSCLVLTAKKEAYQGKEYTSASVDTIGGFEIGKGAELSARVKFENFGEGVWASLYTHPKFLEANGTDSWPKYGEIDVFEYFNYLQSSEVGGHISLYSGEDSQHLISKTPYDTGVSYDDEDFHIYTLRWEEDFVSVLVDGDTKMQIPTPDMTDGNEFNAYQYGNNRHSISLFILYNSSGITEDTPDEMKMYVDWVKCKSLSPFTDFNKIIQFSESEITVSKDEIFYPQIETEWYDCDKTTKFIVENQSIVEYKSDTASNAFQAVSEGTTRIFAINRDGDFDICNITVV